MLPPEAEMWTDQELDVRELNGTSCMEPKIWRSPAFLKRFTSMNYDFIICIFELTVCQLFHSFGVGGVGRARIRVSYTHGWCFAMHVSFSACTHGGCYAMHAMQSQWTCPSEPAHMVDVTQRVPIYTGGNRAWKNECCRLCLKHKSDGDFVAEACFGHVTFLRQNNVGLQFPM